MNIKNKTVLITGGNSGIGFAIAKLLRSQGSQVIITGRDAERLEKAGKELGVDTIQFDVTKSADVARLTAKIKSSYPNLSVLINNAGSGKLYKLAEHVSAFDTAREEFETNYFGPVRLSEALLPFLKEQPEAAVINISSSLAINPRVLMPTYSDSKAALHSHTVALRLTLGCGYYKLLHHIQYQYLHN
jgi:uncharacterized oxidoreductase